MTIKIKIKPDVSDYDNFIMPDPIKINLLCDSTSPQETGEEGDPSDEKDKDNGDKDNENDMMEMGNKYYQLVKDWIVANKQKTAGILIAIVALYYFFIRKKKPATPQYQQQPWIQPDYYGGYY